VSARRGLGRGVVGLALVACASTAHGAGSAGTAAASFLTVGTGASVLAMGGATLASGDGLAASAWNPAALAGVGPLELAMSHAPLPGGASQDWFAAGGTMQGGASRWAVQAVFQREDGIEGRDANNLPTGTISVSDLALTARLARPLGRHVSVGAGAEWVHEVLAGVTGSGFGLEAGLRARVGPFGAALATRHAGGRMSYGGARYDLPTVIAAGGSWQDDARGLRLTVDAESPTHYVKNLRVGAEWQWRHMVALRAGYRRQVGESALETLTGPSFGLGTVVAGLGFDYAFIPGATEANGEHRMGLVWRPAAPAATSAPRTPRAPRSKARRPAVETIKVAPAASAPSVPAPPRPLPTPVVATPAPAETLVTAPATPVAPAAAHRDTVAAPARVVRARVVTPPPSDPVMFAPVPSPVASPRPTHVVVAAGETLYQIARRWGVSVNALMMENDLASDRVQMGTRLRLPQSSGPAR
jgi:LysM domain